MPFFYGVRKSKIHDESEGLQTLDLSTNFDRFDFVHTP